jgi:hypothetical protein
MKGLFDEYYDELLQKVLNHPKVQEYMKETKEENPELTQYELESDALDNFFNEDYKIIFSIDEIYESIVENAREEMEWITSNRETFAKEIDFKLEDLVIEGLDEIRNELEEVLKRKHGK